MPDASASPSPTLTPERTFWQRRVRDPLVAQLTQGITPEKLALTIAVGSALALFPILGTTTLLCFLIGLMLRLNQPIIQLLNQALWPVHVPAILGCVKLGGILFNVPHAKISIKAMNYMLWNEPRLFFERFGVTVFHTVVAWAVLAPFYIALVYYVMLPILRGVVRLKAEAAAKATAKGLDHPVP